MKTFCLLLLILTLLKIYYCTLCDDGLECPGKFTCCQGASRTSCCPYENAVCCEDKYHCCPRGYKCNIKDKKCEEMAKTEKSIDLDLIELSPANLTYKKGWNALYYNCFNDIKLIKDELISILENIFKGEAESRYKAKAQYYELIKDSKITSKDCIDFFNEVFGDYKFWQ